MTQARRVGNTARTGSLYDPESERQLASWTGTRVSKLQGSISRADTLLLYGARGVNNKQTNNLKKKTKPNNRSF